ncbi:MAG: dGTP triphosphohydrolase [Acidobacteriota bacterium]
MWNEFEIRDRLSLVDDEGRRLAPWATPSIEALRSGVEDRDDPLRPAFQRDRDRILHSRAFRRLKHKTQVFVPHLADHPRTRLTHTLEVAQVGRTIARALALNEDLVEAIALGHDLGHTAFGHTGETVLKEILGGEVSEVSLPPEVVAAAGTFKHNYHSVRVVDLLEHRYDHPGLGLTDQVREGILKHTSWSEGFAFPLPNPEGLALADSCHFEGQTVAVADEIAQQTHDLEDGLRAGSVRLDAVEELEIARVVISRLGPEYQKEDRRWLRQNLLIRGMISLFVTDVIENSAEMLRLLAARHEFSDRQSFLAAKPPIPRAAVWFADDVHQLFIELKTFIYRFIINHPQVNRQDWRARKVMTALFRAFWLNPRTLPSYVLLRARDELGFSYLREVPLGAVAKEVRDRYHASPGFVRLIVDHLAGMSDRFALEEFRSLEQPTPEQSFPGGLR